MTCISGTMNFGGISKQYVDETFLPLTGGRISGDVSIGGSQDYISIDASGDFKLHGEATQWDDLRFDSTSAKVGTNLKPTFDETNLGLLFADDDDKAMTYYVVQFSHNKKNGSDISPHIHFIQNSINPPTFVMTYRWYNNGDVIPAWTTIESSTLVFEYSGTPILQILSFPDIDGSNMTRISSVMDVKINRKNGDALVGDCLMKEFDIHYQIDSLGSNNEYIK